MLSMEISTRTAIDAPGDCWGTDCQVNGRMPVIDCGWVESRSCIRVEDETIGVEEIAKKSTSIVGETVEDWRVPGWMVCIEVSAEVKVGYVAGIEEVGESRDVGGFVRGYVYTAYGDGRVGEEYVGEDDFCSGVEIIAVMVLYIVGDDESDTSSSMSRS